MYFLFYESKFSFKWQNSLEGESLIFKAMFKNTLHNYSSWTMLGIIYDAFRKLIGLFIKWILQMWKFQNGGVLQILEIVKDGLHASL